MLEVESGARGRARFDGQYYPSRFHSRQRRTARGSGRDGIESALAIPRAGLPRGAPFTAAVDYDRSAYGLSLHGRPPDRLDQVATLPISTETLEFLGRTDLFAGVPREVLVEIAGTMHSVEIPAGGTLFNKGDVGDAVYFVLEGRVHLEAGGIVLLTRGPGECVGEFALIDDVPRSATAAADSDARLLVWGREAFRHALDRTAAVAAGVFRVLTGKLREDISIQVTYSLEQERWKQDLERARQIQTGMLPVSELANSRVEVSGHCRPAQDVGGDYYDYIWADDDQLGLMVADVTGHGFYSALFVAMVKSCLHTQAQIDHGPAKIMGALRRILSMSLHRSLLMSCCYMLMDFRAQTLTYSNAGHPYPYLFHCATGELEPLSPMDPILGAQGIEAPSFEEKVTLWSPGDFVVLYTDGITEARQKGGELFGHGRLEELIMSNRDASARRLRDAILEAVSGHGRETVQGDDVTLVVARAV